MKINSIWRDKGGYRTVIEFKHDGVTWFRNLDDDVYYQTDKFEKWLNSLIEDARVRA